jgi:hypothetical protein
MTSQMMKARSILTRAKSLLRKKTHLRQNPRKSQMKCPRKSPKISLRKKTDLRKSIRRCRRLRKRINLRKSRNQRKMI